MRSWNQFGAIETIYEEEREFSSSSLSPSSSSSSPPTLQSRINAWSLDSGREPDVLIHVQGTSFRLHKDRMVLPSSYLKRHLTGVTNLTLSPPLNITPETFAAVVEFCYSRRVHLTATNVAAVRVAAELLGMAEGENLRDVAESYFQRLLAVDSSTILSSCVVLLPEAETRASLVSRCIEALLWQNDDVACLDDVVRMEPQDFLTVVDSLNIRLSNYDVLYKIVDLYLKENKNGKVTEEQKTEICNKIDCSKLSTETLVKCVQNPRMPLRFIVRAIVMEHVNTRRSVAAAANGANQLERTSLREFLQTAQMKEAMDSTYCRIQSLEKQLNGMKKILRDHHQAAAEEDHNNIINNNNNNVLNSSERSASFHFVPAESSKIQRGGRGSISSSGFLLENVTKRNNNADKYNLSVATSDDGNKIPKVTRFFRHKFITGLKNAFRISNSN